MPKKAASSQMALSRTPVGFFTHSDAMMSPQPSKSQQPPTTVALQRKIDTPGSYHEPGRHSSPKIPSSPDFNANFDSTMSKDRSYYIPDLSRLGVLVSSSAESLTSPAAIMNPSVLSAVVFGLGALVALFKYGRRHGYHSAGWMRDWGSKGGHSAIKATKKKRKPAGRRKPVNDVSANKVSHLMEASPASVSPATPATEGGYEENTTIGPISKLTVGSVCRQEKHMMASEECCDMLSNVCGGATATSQKYAESYLSASLVISDDSVNEGEGMWQVVPCRSGKSDKKSSHSISQHGWAPQAEGAIGAKQIGRNNTHSSSQLRQREAGRCRVQDRSTRGFRGGKKQSLLDGQESRRERKEVDYNSRQRLYPERKPYCVAERQYHHPNRSRQPCTSLTQGQSTVQTNHIRGNAWSQQSAWKQIGLSTVNVNRWKQKPIVSASKQLDSLEFPSMMDKNGKVTVKLTENALADQSNHEIFCISRDSHCGVYSNEANIINNERHGCNIKSDEGNSVNTIKNAHNSQSNSESFDDNPLTPVCPYINDESKYDSIDITGIDEIQSCPSCPERSTSPNLLETPQVDDMEDTDAGKYKEFILTSLNLPKTIIDNPVRAKSSERSIVSSICASVGSEENPSSALPSSLGEGEIAAISIACATSRWCDLVDSDFSDDEDTTRDDDDNTIMGDDTSFDRYSRHSQHDQIPMRCQNTGVEDHHSNRSSSEIITLNSIDRNWRSEASRLPKQQRSGSDTYGQTLPKEQSHGSSNSHRRHQYRHDCGHDNCNITNNYNRNQRCHNDRRNSYQGEESTDGNSPVSSRNSCRSGPYQNQQQRSCLNNFSVNQQSSNHSSNQMYSKCPFSSQSQKAYRHHTTVVSHYRNVGNSLLKPHDQGNSDSSNKNQLLNGTLIGEEQTKEKKNFYSSPTVSTSESPYFYAMEMAPFSHGASEHSVVPAIVNDQDENGSAVVLSEALELQREWEPSPSAPSVSMLEHKQLIGKPSAINSDNHNWREVKSHSKIRANKQAERSSVQFSH